MFVPFVGAVHRHLKAWSLGPVLQCLERFLDEPTFRRTLIQKPSAFTRPQGRTRSQGPKLCQASSTSGIFRSI